MGRWYLTTALLKRSTALLETFPGPVEASDSPVTAVAERKNLPLDFFPFPAHVDAELSVSVSSSAGFGRIITNFSAGPYPCSLILGS